MGDISPKPLFFHIYIFIVVIMSLCTCLHLAGELTLNRSPFHVGSGLVQKNTLDSLRPTLVASSPPLLRELQIHPSDHLGRMGDVTRHSGTFTAIGRQDKT